LYLFRGTRWLDVNLLDNTHKPSHGKRERELECGCALSSNHSNKHRMYHWGLRAQSTGRAHGRAALGGFMALSNKSHICATSHWKSNWWWRAATAWHV